jgi:hypothetical protein
VSIYFHKDGDVIASIGYNGMPTEPNLKRLFESLGPGETKPPVQPNVYLEISILHPNQKSLSAGVIQSFVKGGLVYATLSLGVGSWFWKLCVHVV